RHRALHRERRVGHLPQPVGPRPHARRVLQRRGRRGRRRDGARRPRGRRRRLDPHPRLVHRARRPQADAGARHQPDGRGRRAGRPAHVVAPGPGGDGPRVLAAPPRHDPGAWWSPPSPARPFAAALDDAPPRGLRVGVLVDPPIEGLPVDPACRRAAEVAVATLEAAGHHVVDEPLPLPPADELVAAFTTIWNVGGAGVDLEDPDRVEPLHRALREAARAIDSWEYARGVHRAQLLSRRVVDAFVDRVDLLVTPTMACLPPPVGAWRAGTEHDPRMALLNSYPMAVFTSLFNVTGQPAVSLPVHHDEATGLPVGVQLVAAPWQEH